ncbi:hypothetical protein pipiens_003891 [Culex pipiens pipiens]|uniref:Uncharacterized protein n=1 Tax=Culex pipiens pipiens TaxID=38569 RepID=A0ABD1CR32_CULPP
MSEIYPETAAGRGEWEVGQQQIEFFRTLPHFAFHLCREPPRPRPGHRTYSGHRQAVRNVSSNNCGDKFVKRATSCHDLARADSVRPGLQQAETPGVATSFRSTIAIWVRSTRSPSSTKTDAS